MHTFQNNTNLSKNKIRIAAKYFSFHIFQKCVNDTDARTHTVTTHPKGEKGVCTSGSPADPNLQTP